MLPIVPMLAKLPDASIRLVPAPAPVLIPVVPLSVVPVIVLAVEIVPNPDAIDPDERAPTCCRDDDATLAGNVVPNVSLATSSPVAIYALAICDPFHVPVVITPVFGVTMSPLYEVAPVIAPENIPFVAYKSVVEIFDVEALSSVVFPVTLSVFEIVVAPVTPRVPSTDNLLSGVEVPIPIFPEERISLIPIAVP